MKTNTFQIYLVRALCLCLSAYMRGDIDYLNYWLNISENHMKKKWQGKNYYIYRSYCAGVAGCGSAAVYH